MILFSVILLLLYLFVLVLMLFGIQKISIIKITKTGFNKTKFSIIIPFKDEAENLDMLLQSLSKIQYDKTAFEIIMINDYSSDNSVEIIKKYSDINIQIIHNKISSGSPKKDALQLGVKQAKHKWIITTDADCEIPINWLELYHQTIEKISPKMILAPVIFFDSNRFLHQFQQIEFLSLQAMTMGSLGLKKPFLSNGANICFEKDAFIKLKGYEGNTHIASGDDVFLLEKFNHEFPERIVFLKNPLAIVKTKAQNNWREIIQQKIRWGSKTKNYQSVIPKLIGLIILLTNILMMIMATASLINVNYLLFILVKFMIDVLLIKIINKFYKAKLNFSYLIISFIIYPFYYIYLIIKSLSGKYIWKGRKY